MSIEGAPARSTLTNVEILRFVAAFFVLVEHLLHSFERGYVHSGALQSPVPVLWRSGVDIFFVISGFIMLHVSGCNFGSGAAAKDFIARRIIRVVPMYWLFTTLMIAAALALPGRVNNSALDPVHAGLSYLFIPWPRPDGQLMPPLGPGWTLNFEMFFYVIFAIGLCFRKVVGLTVIFAAFALAVLAGRVFGLGLGPFVFWTQPIIIEFLFGIALAAVFGRGIRLGLATRIGLVAGGLVLGGYAELHDFSFGTRWLWAGIPSLMIAVGVILGPELPDSRLRRWLIVGGGASYALYLSHLFTLKAMGIVWQKTGIDSSLGFLIVAGVVAVAVAVIVHLYVETPMIRMARRLLIRRPQRVATASP